MRRHIDRRINSPDEDTVLVVAHWESAGKGLSAGEQVLASYLTGRPESATSALAEVGP
ncbi:hypothetical protein GCM10022226_33150 [Sphaerisporangium flaviroseum]|uniref:Uncharacterized protein n=1 Tax=Sphaerisporangium flaviroseum TaxID=509199 RepID=A0ABP7I4X0_9ACTN